MSAALNIRNSDAQQATITAHESRTRQWAFDASFDFSMHPALVDSDEVAANYTQDLLNMALLWNTFECCRLRAT